jgi:hypothetical protein
MCHLLIFSKRSYEELDLEDALPVRLLVGVVMPPLYRGAGGAA